MAAVAIGKEEQNGQDRRDGRRQRKRCERQNKQGKKGATTLNQIEIQNTKEKRKKWHSITVESLNKTSLGLAPNNCRDSVPAVPRLYSAIN